MQREWRSTGVLPLWDLRRTSMLQEPLVLLCKTDGGFAEVPPLRIGRQTSTSRRSRLRGTSAAPPCFKNYWLYYAKRMEVPLRSCLCGTSAGFPCLQNPVILLCKTDGGPAEVHPAWYFCRTSIFKKTHGVPADVPPPRDFRRTFHASKNMSCIMRNNGGHMEVPSPWDLRRTSVLQKPLV